jgi:UDP-glucuronate 4-epimerase
LPLHGDGAQSRDFTHVADAVDATFRAAFADDPATIDNVGGGHEATLREIVALLEELSEREAVIDRRPEQAGDVRRTAADTSRAREDLGWQPSVGLRDRRRSQLDRVQARRDALAGTVRFARRRPAASGGVETAATGGGGIG